MATARKYYENQCERYGGIVEVTIEDYQSLNPTGRFEQYPYGIYERMDDGTQEQIAVITVDWQD